MKGWGLKTVSGKCCCHHNVHVAVHTEHFSWSSWQRLCFVSVPEGSRFKSRPPTPSLFAQDILGFSQFFRVNTGEYLVFRPLVIPHTFWSIVRQPFDAVQMLLAQLNKPLNKYKRVGRKLWWHCTCFVLFIFGSDRVSADLIVLLFLHLTLYAPCIILQYVYEPTRCTKFL